MKPTEFKAIRKQLNLTQPQLAEVLGVCPKTVWNYEHGVCAIKKLVADYMVNSKPHCKH